MSSPDIVDTLGPNDALIFLQPWQLGILELKNPWNWFTNTWQFSLIFHPLQITFIHYKPRIVTAIRGL